jgi:hypothetical protein
VHIELQLGNVREKDHLEDLGTDRRIILELIFEKEVGGWKLHWSDSGQEHVEGVCKYGNQHLDST